MVVLALGVTAWGCGGGSGDDEATPPTAGEVTAATTSPTAGRWLDQFDGLRPAGEVDGQPVAVDEDERTIYVEDCNVARRLTSQGERFGPTDRDAEGNSTPGYGSVCSS